MQTDRAGLETSKPALYISGRGRRTPHVGGRQPTAPVASLSVTRPRLSARHTYQT
jgi:hypothetical protein